MLIWIIIIGGAMMWGEVRELRKIEEYNMRE